MRYKFPGLCNHWWAGEYAELPVEHECYLKPAHAELHTCGCGAHPPLCRWCGKPVEECLPNEPGEWVHSDTGMSVCWDAPDGESDLAADRG